MRSGSSFVKELFRGDRAIAPELRHALAEQAPEKKARVLFILQLIPTLKNKRLLLGFHSAKGAAPCILRQREQR